MARFYSNENFPRRVVEALRHLGHDVLTSLEAGNANQRVPDEDVLSFATEKRRALLTLNRQDFFRLHRSTDGHHSGIIACTRDDASPADMAHRIHDAVNAEGGLDGKVLRIVRPSL